MADPKLEGALRDYIDTARWLMSELTKIEHDKEKPQLPASARVAKAQAEVISEKLTRMGVSTGRSDDESEGVRR